MTTTTGNDAGTINRDVSTQAKGPRLQRLRACELILDGISKSDAVQVYVRLEGIGDVLYGEATKTASQLYSEENKNLDAESRCSFVSQPVINSMVLFVDLWINSAFSRKLMIGFYSTSGIAKEQKNGERVTKLGLHTPAKAILELLMAGDLSDLNLLPTIKGLVIDEYARQYAGKNTTGHLDQLRKWTEGDWIEFLGRITWKLDQFDHEELTKILLDKIRRCPLYSARLHSGKESLILSVMADRIDACQNTPDPLERYVHASDIKLLFREVAAGEHSVEDPTWQIWSSVAPADARNLAEKIDAACTTSPIGLKNTYARRAGASLYEQKAMENDKRMLALKYQVYEACCATIEGEWLGTEAVDEVVLRQRFSELFVRSIQRVDARAKDFKYPVTNPHSLEDMVLELFDSCYLSFDKA